MIRPQTEISLELTPESKTDIAQGIKSQQLRWTTQIQKLMKDLYCKVWRRFPQRKHLNVSYYHNICSQCTFMIPFRMTPYAKNSPLHRYTSLINRLNVDTFPT